MTAPVRHGNSGRREAVAPRTVSILGATGSIGASTVDLIARRPDVYRVEALCSNRNADALAKLARDLGARFAAVADPAAYRTLKQALSGTGIEAAGGVGAVVEAAQRPADWVMAAIAGSTGLAPTLAAIERVIPGFAEHMRAEGRKTTERALLSRGITGIRAKTIIINLPGSPAGAVESLNAIAALLPHTVDVVHGASH